MADMEREFNWDDTIEKDSTDFVLLLVPGSKGRCKVKVRNWKGNDGEERQSNEIVRFYPKEDSANTGSGYRAGDF